MKQLKSTLITMLLCLIFINVIQEIKTETLESLYYSNEELFKPKTKNISELNKDSKTLLNRNNSFQSPNNKKSIKKILTKPKQVISLKKLPIGLDYLPVKGNNVYLRSINFFIRFMKSINDNRDFTTLSKKVSRNCNKINIFKVLRESILNCKVITRNLNENKPVIKIFNLGCMANILSNIQSACPRFEKNSSAKNLQKTINILTEVPRGMKKKLEMIARIFVKRLSFILRVFPRHIVERMEELKRLQKMEKSKKLSKSKNNKIAKLDKKKQEEKKHLEKLLKSNNSKKANKGNKKKVNKKKTLKKKLVDKNFIKKNTKEDENFVKITELSGSKSMMIASFIGQYVLKILMLA